MKVLVFTTLYPNNVWPNHGVFVKERMTAVARLRGYDLRVVAPVPYYPPLKFGSRAAFNTVVRKEIIEGVQVYHPRYLLLPKIGMLLHGLTMFLGVFFFVRKLQRDFDFDIIDAHYLYPDGFAAVLLGALLNKPVVVSARGSDINLFSNFPIIRRFLCFTMNRATHLIAVCKALKEEMIALGADQTKLTVVPNGVDGNKFYPSPMNLARQRLRLPDNDKIILSVGGLIPRKGFELLIRGLKLVLEDRELSNALLIIVGEGSWRGTLERLIESLNLQKKVLLVGAIPHNELRFWYASADLFCLASTREGWPNVVMESLACGTPVVAANVWGIPEIITSDSIGTVCGRTVKEFADAMSTALRKTWDCRLIARYTQDRSWSHTAASVGAVMASVVDTQESLEVKAT